MPAEKETMSPETVKFFRTALTSAQTALNSMPMPDGLEEPWKSHFNKIKSDYDSALRDLPPTDQAPAALNAHGHLQSLYSILTNLNGLACYMGECMNRMKGAHASALNSAADAEITRRVTAGELIPKDKLTPLVDAALAERLKAGDLVPRETVTQLCSEATKNGLAAGLKQAADAAQATAATAAVIATRKGVLQTAGVPLPGDDLWNLLGGTDAEFTAARTTAEGRRKELEDAGVVLASDSVLWSKVWLPEDQYKTFAALAKETVVATRGGHEPFLGGQGRPDGAQKIPVFFA
jgi:hypothetical protein